MENLVGCIVNFKYRRGHRSDRQVAVLTQDDFHIGGYDIDDKQFKTFLVDFIEDLFILYRPTYYPQPKYTHANSLPKSLKVYKNNMLLAEFSGHIDVNLAGFRLVVE